MLPLLRSLTAPFASLILLILGSGLLNTFTPVRLEMELYNNEAIGLITASLYLGILIGSLRLDRWIAKVGHIRAFLYFAGCSSLLVLGQAIWLDPYYWSILRFFGGICMAGIFIVIESWLLVAAPYNLRGAILSVYLAVLYGALSLGQFLINLSNPLSSVPFFIVAFLFAASLLPLILIKASEPKLGPTSRLKAIQLFKLSPLGFFGGVISGIILAVIYGLVPVYAKEIGMSISEIGNLMALLIFGGLIFQWPFGKLADKKNRRDVLLLASLLTTITALAIGIFNHQIPALLFILSFLFGGFAFTIYPLSMAYTCEKLSDEQIVSATGGFVLSYGIGAIAGPIIAPLTMDFLGSAGLFYFLAACSLLLFVAGLKKRTPATIATEPKLFIKEKKALSDDDLPLEDDA